MSRPTKLTIRYCEQRYHRDFSLPVKRWPIVQQALRGKKYKLDGVFGLGRCVGTGTNRILRCKGVGQFGTSTYCVADALSELTEHCVRDFEPFNWHGIFNIGLICDDDSIPRPIDITDRLSGGVTPPTLVDMIR